MHHHPIQSIPEDRASSGFAQHPSADKQTEGCSPDPHSSATTTGTTSTPTSVGNSTSPPPNESANKTGGAAPQFPSGSSLQAGPQGHVLHGQGSFLPSSLAEGMMGPRYGPSSSNPVDNAEIGPYNTSPGDASRYNAASFPCAIKLLVSNNVAGSIIGRSGQTISDLQSQSSTRIKLSQTGDYYPGSQDRVCLVQGQLENVKGALGLLLDRLFMLQEHQHSQHMAWQSNRTEGSPPFDFVVRILVPSSSCGMIIGKSGSNIRQMEEASGVASVRLSPKDIVDPNYPSATISSATSERVVTLTGATLESCLRCLFIIIEGMTSHPDICRYTNMTTSYSRLMPDPFTAGQGAIRPGPPPESSQSGEANLCEGSHYGPPQQGGIGRRVSSSPDLSAPFLTHRPAPMPLEPRPAPVGPHGNRDTLAYKPMIGGPSSSYSPIRPMASPRMPQSGPPMFLHPLMEDPSISTSAPQVSSSMSAPDLMALQMESMHLSTSPQQHQPPPSTGPSHHDYPLFPSPQLAPPGPAHAGFTAQVVVPDNMIGSILGRGGRTLNELQAQSGTRIRISQRGEYIPGTRNRIVIVRGPTAQSVSLAQYLMGQQMILPRTATYQVPTTQAPGMQPFHDDQHGHLYHHDSHPQPAPPSSQAPQPQGQLNQRTAQGGPGTGH